MYLANLFLTLIISSTQSQFLGNPEYIGGDQFNFVNTNPFFIPQHYIQENAINSNLVQCQNIPGVGLPVLSIKKFLISVDLQFDNTHNNTQVKIIFFRESTNNSNGSKVYKVVFQIRSFQDDSYIGIEAQVNRFGFPSFEILNYIMETDIDRIKICLNEPTIDPSNFVGCGDLKAIYSSNQAANPAPNLQSFGINTNPSQDAYSPPRPVTFGPVNFNSAQNFFAQNP